jgi:AbrB family looped-hinge helix DNA binding protein
MSANLTTVTSKGQITIPKAVRDALGIAEKDQLLFVIEEDRAILIPLRQRPVSELFAALPATRPFPGQQAVRETIHRELGERIDRGEERSAFSSMRTYSCVSSLATLLKWRKRRLLFFEK